MNNILLCDHCAQAFNSVERYEDLPQINQEREEMGQEPIDFRPPMILHNCGCTFCGRCAMELIDEKIPENLPENLTPEMQEVWLRRQCPTCSADIQEETHTDCRRNNKLPDG